MHGRLGGEPNSVVNPKRWLFGLSLSPSVGPTVAWNGFVGHIGVCSSKSTMCIILLWLYPPIHSTKNELLGSIVCEPFRMLYVGGIHPYVPYFGHTSVSGKRQQINKKSSCSGWTMSTIFPVYQRLPGKRVTQMFLCAHFSSFLIPNYDYQYRNTNMGRLVNSQKCTFMYSELISY